MYCVRKIKEDIFWVGGNDRRIALFENMYPVPNGMSYNAYVVLDEKTVLLDTVDKAISGLFFDNLSHVLNGRKLDYLIVNHMEPDHCATMAELVLRYPEVRIISNAKVLTMIKQFFNFDAEARFITIKEGETFTTGAHSFSFYMAPMVHWPEAMFTYDALAKTLFSADAFGSFGAINGNLFADEVNFDRDCLNEARRYYTNIVGQFGAQVAAALAKVIGLQIDCICPLHGMVWRENISYFINKYKLWSAYIPEEQAIMLVYASVYGNTENAVDILASQLSQAGIKNIAVYDVSNTPHSAIVSECFRCSHIVFASTTYNGKIFFNMSTVLQELKLHNLQNRTIGILQNGSWAATAGALIKEALSTLKNITILEETVNIKSSLKDAQLAEIKALAQAIVASFGK